MERWTSRTLFFALGSGPEVSKWLDFFFLYFFFTDYAYALEFKGTFEQGSLVIGKTIPSSQIYIDKQKVKVTKDGYFLFAISRDRKNDVVILYKINSQTKFIWNLRH